jgi:hypothetical protein
MEFIAVGDYMQSTNTTVILPYRPKVVNGNKAKLMKMAH